MKTVYKYKLHPVTYLTLPEGSKILSAGVQKEDIFIWVLIDKDIMAYETRTFHVYGTGDQIDSSLNLKFIETVFITEFVWHIFEVIK
jgi:hypothetical protein